MVVQKLEATPNGIEVARYHRTVRLEQIRQEIAERLWQLRHAPLTPREREEHQDSICWLMQLMEEPALPDKPA
jgi:hypothetical protein